MRIPQFSLIAIAVAIAVYAGSLLIGNDYVFFAGYVVLQFIVLATAWNILGGYCGYVNFGTAAFFAMGAYSSVAIHKLWQANDALPVSLPVLIIVAGIIAGLMGLAVGYLSLRLRGVFFAISTLALAVVLQTLVINWDFVGGSRGAYIIRPNDLEIGSFKLPYIQYLFILMLALAVGALVAARAIERSRLGYGFATIRDDELAAEACGVPTLKLKLVATTISGAFMGMTGATFPYYIGYLEPASAFGLQYAVNAIAMPMIGGTTSWVGPLIGAILLGTMQQIATVTISSVINLMLVGVLLVAFVIMAPNGIVGLVQGFLRVAAPGGLNGRAAAVIAVALFTFILGILGVIFGLAGLSGGGARVVIVQAGFLFGGSVLAVAAAFGLLTLQSWAPWVTAAALVAGAIGAVFDMGLNPEHGRVIPGIVVALSAIGALYIVSRGVRDIYARKAAVVTA